MNEEVDETFWDPVIHPTVNNLLDFCEPRLLAWGSWSRIRPSHPTSHPCASCELHPGYGDYYSEGHSGNAVLYIVKAAGNNWLSIPEYFERVFDPSSKLLCELAHLAIPKDLIRERVDLIAKGNEYERLAQVSVEYALRQWTTGHLADQSVLCLSTFGIVDCDVSAVIVRALLAHVAVLEEENRTARIMWLHATKKGSETVAANLAHNMFVENSDITLNYVGFKPSRVKELLGRLRKINYPRMEVTIATAVSGGGSWTGVLQEQRVDCLFIHDQDLMHALMSEGLFAKYQPYGGVLLTSEMDEVCAFTRIRHEICLSVLGRSESIASSIQIHSIGDRVHGRSAKNSTQTPIGIGTRYKRYSLRVASSKCNRRHVGVGTLRGI